MTYLVVAIAGLGCARNPDVADRKNAAVRTSSQDKQPASPALTAPKRNSCHRVGPLACEERPAASGPDFVKHLNSCLENYRELDYGRIQKVTAADRLDRAAGMPEAGVAGVATFAVTAHYGADAAAPGMRSVYLAAEYGDGLCLVDQLIYPRDPTLPCREQFHFRWEPLSPGKALRLIVETETTCSYVRGPRTRCASAEFRVTDGSFWFVREASREGACNS